MNKVLFLDRDGVINISPAIGEYVKNVSEFIFLPSTFEGLKNFVNNNYNICIISNQRGVNLGLMSLEDLTNVHDYMINELSKHGIAIMDAVYCTHGKNECNCRKPKIGGFSILEERNNIDKINSIFIGDSINDFEAGKNYGVNTFIIKPKDPLTFSYFKSRKIRMFNNLVEISEHIIYGEKRCT